MPFIRTKTGPGGREEMIRMRFATKGILFTALILFCIAAGPAAVRGQQADQAKPPSYTIPEYNAFQAANAEKDAQARLKLLDDFSAKFPISARDYRHFPIASRCFRSCLIPRRPTRTISSSRSGTPQSKARISSRNILNPRIQN